MKNMNKFNSISEVIFRLGGTGVVSRLLNTNPSTVSNWKKNNKIPKSHLPKFYDLINNLNNSKNEFSNNSLHDPLNSNAFFPKKNIDNYFWWYRVLQNFRIVEDVI